MKKYKLLFLCGVLSLSNSIFAYEAGDVLVRVGAATVNPNESSSQVVLQSSSTALGKISVDNSTQLGITGSYLFSPHMGIELLAATPFKHTLRGSSGAVNGLKIATTQQLPPTINLQYYPATQSSAFQPYVGVGVNYTAFFDSQTTNSLNSTLGVSHSSIDLQNSWGFAGEIGIDYAINEKWFLNAATWYIDIDTTGKIKLSNGDQLNVNAAIDPWVSMVGVGYRF